MFGLPRLAGIHLQWTILSGLLQERKEASVNHAGGQPPECWLGSSVRGVGPLGASTERYIPR